MSLALISIHIYFLLCFVLLLQNGPVKSFQLWLSVDFTLFIGTRHDFNKFEVGVGFLAKFQVGLGPYILNK